MSVTFVIINKKMISLFNESVLLLTMNFVIINNRTDAKLT